MKLVQDLRSHPQLCVATFLYQPRPMIMKKLEVWLVDGATG